MTAVERQQLHALWRRHRALERQQQAVVEQRNAIRRRLENDFRISKPEATALRATRQLLEGAAYLPSKKIESLLANGADPNAKNADGETSLLLACYRKGDEAIAKLLIENGADVNAIDELGNTPLIVSASDDRLKIVRLLVEHGADVNAQNIEGDTPLTNAAIWGESRTVSYLLSKGADPGLPDGVGCTALSLAKQSGHSRIVQMLDSALVPTRA